MTLFHVFTSNCCAFSLVEFRCYCLDYDLFPLATYKLVYLYLWNGSETLFNLLLHESKTGCCWPEEEGGRGL